VSLLGMDCRSNKREKTLLILSGELRIQTPPLGSASPLLRHEIGAAWVMKSAYPHDRENNTFWVPDACCCRACRLVDDTGLRRPDLRTIRSSIPPTTSPCICTNLGQYQQEMSHVWRWREMGICKWSSCKDTGLGLGREIRHTK